MPRPEEVANLEYKKFPMHLSHNNPKSKDYIHSELDEYY